MSVTKKPGPREKKDKPSNVEVIGVGNGGIEELRVYLSDDMVAWALLRFQLGTGPSMHTKFVSVHFNGDGVSTALRSKANARSNDLVKLLGETEAKLELKFSSEVTVHSMMEKLLPAFADGGNYTAATLTAEYEKLMSKEHQQCHRSSSLRHEIKTAKDKPGRKVTAEDAIKAVGSERSMYNWVLLEPLKLELHNAGSGGLEEMKNWLAPEKVLFGAVRLAFGKPDLMAEGGPSIVKYIFVHWIGPKVSAVRRGQFNANVGNAEMQVKKVCIIAIRREYHNKDDLQLEDLISEIKRLTVLDGADSDTPVMSVAAYMSALEDEREEIIELMEQEEEARSVREGHSRHSGLRRSFSGEKPGMPDVMTAIDTLRSPSTLWNWALFTTQQRVGLVPPGGLPVPQTPQSKADVGESSLISVTAPPASPRSLVNTILRLGEELEQKDVEAASTKVAQLEVSTANKGAEVATVSAAVVVAKTIVSSPSSSPPVSDVEEEEESPRKAPPDLGDLQAKAEALNKKKTVQVLAPANSSFLGPEGQVAEAKTGRKFVQFQVSKANKVPRPGGSPHASDVEEQEEDQEAPRKPPLDLGDLQAKAEALNGRKSVPFFAPANSSFLGPGGQVAEGDTEASHSDSESDSETSRLSIKEDEQRQRQRSIALTNERGTPPPAAAWPQPDSSMWEVHVGELFSLQGWRWARCYFHLERGRLRWWPSQAESAQKPQPAPIDSVLLVDGVDRWACTTSRGTRLELTRPGRKRHTFTASDENEARLWVRAIRRHISYIETLMVWPLPPEGRQGDCSSYGL